MANDEEITWAYRLFLDREPENKDVIAHFRNVGGTKELRAAFMAAAEFRSQIPAVAYLPIGLPSLDVEWQVGGDTLQALLLRVKETWNKLGNDCPHWSVLSLDEFLPQGMHEEKRAKFNESGRGDAELVIAIMNNIGVSPKELPKIFEFGCGLARVTPHLARNFDHVTGCDVSLNHLKEAKLVIAQSGVNNVQLTQAEFPDFGMKDPFNVWFSRIVLQHNSPPLIAMILRKALQMLLPGGLAIFQVPTYAIGYRFRVAEYLNAPSDPGRFEMHCLPQNAIFEIAKECRCLVKEVREDNCAGSSSWISNSIVLQKEESAHN